ncbi:hypothetical protein TRVL_06489 [Trypanosoma vivax]|nr:hypothetical protein TRVL_06489 [Trypanosoma vivax]
MTLPASGVAEVKVPVGSIFFFPGRAKLWGSHLPPYAALLSRPLCAPQCRKSGFSKDAVSQRCCFAFSKAPAAAWHEPLPHHPPDESRPFFSHPSTSLSISALFHDRLFDRTPIITQALLLQCKALHLPSYNKNRRAIPVLIAVISCCSSFLCIAHCWGMQQRSFHKTETSF